MTEKLIIQTNKTDILSFEKKTIVFQNIQETGQAISDIHLIRSGLLTVPIQIQTSGLPEEDCIPWQQVKHQTWKIEAAKSQKTVKKRTRKRKE